MKTACALYLACILPNMAAVVLWDESIAGDLADDYTTPTLLTAVLGENRVIGRLTGLDFDLDILTVTVGAGHQLSALRLVNYTTGTLGNLGFIGMQPGSNLSSPPSSSFSDPIGYVLYGTWAIGTDILPNMVVGPPFNLTNPLPSGQYAVWLNEVGPASTYEWSFEVTTIPEPSSIMLWIGGFLTPFFLRTRPRS